MAMTSAQQLDMYHFFAVAFDAAPGTIYMNQLDAAIEGGMTTQQIVQVFTTKPEFTNSYPTFLSNASFATKLVDNVVGTSATADAKLEAVADIESAMTAGWTRDAVIFKIFGNLAEMPYTDAKWGNTAKQMANQVVVAQHYTETQLGASTDLATLRSVIANVTATSDVSTPEAIAALSGSASGQTITLTPGADPINGTAGSDTINALSVKADGANANTLTSFDVIDGGAGTDTLNIYTDSTAPGFNMTLPATATVKNVEIVNILNTGTAAAFGDASKFEGVTQLWQNSDAVAVTKLAATTTAGFKDLTATALAVTAADAATSANIALTAAKGVAVTNVATLAVNGLALNSVTVAGTIAQTSTAATDPAASLALGVTVATAATTATINTAVNTVLTTVANLAGVALTTVDASASTGAVKYQTGAATVTTIKSGAGADDLKISTATSATVSASVESGAGNDKVEVATTGAGTTTVNTGAGNDSVTLTSGINTKTQIDGGEGTDTISLAGRSGQRRCPSGCGGLFPVRLFRARNAAPAGTAARGRAH